MSRRLPVRLAAALAVAGTLLFTAAWLASGALQPAYDPARHDISALAAMDARHPALMVVGIVALAVAVGGAACALARGWRACRPAAAALGVAGVATLAAGLLRIDCSERASAACRERAAAGLMSWHDQAHNVTVVVGVLALALAPVLLARSPFWGGLRAFSVLTATVTLALVAVYLGAFWPEVNGLVQRALVSVPLLWMAVTSARLARVPGAEAQRGARGVDPAHAVHAAPRRGGG